MRFGLCCTFRHQPIQFRTTTVATLSRLDRPAALEKLSELCLANADSLMAALHYCAKRGIGCFRVNSQILPIRTHAECGFQVTDLPSGAEIEQRFRECGDFVRARRMRTCFHPDQFVVLNSPDPGIVERSLAEVEYQAEVAEWIAADVINIHAGGVYGDKQKALADLAINLERLSPAARRKLTVENDDVSFTPADLLPLCQTTGVPLVYDVHHHRCNPDGLSLEQATRSALKTWDREPLFHISSPRQGWSGPRPRRHRDFIRLIDFPDCWKGRRITVEVEAKAKEAAVLKLMRDLRR